MGRPESRAASSRSESRAARPLSGLERQRSTVGDRPESRLNERPRTARERMQERVDNLKEARAEQAEAKETEADVDCATNCKVIWMMFSTSFLPKAFLFLGVIVLIFGVVMLVVGLATESFNSGKTVGPILIAIGVAMFVLGFLGLYSSRISLRQIAPDQEKGNMSKTNDREDYTENLEPFDIPEDMNDKHRPKSRQHKDPSGAETFSVVARPRILPPLSRDEKPKKKRKPKKPPTKDFDRNGSFVLDGNRTREKGDDENLQTYRSTTFSFE